MIQDEQARFLQALLDAREGGGKLCLRCRCCEMERERCDICEGEGEIEFDDGEWDICDTCNGTGGWWVCLGGCDEEGEHQLKEDTSADLFSM